MKNWIWKSLAGALLLNIGVFLTPAAEVRAEGEEPCEPDAQFPYCVCINKGVGSGWSCMPRPELERECEEAKDCYI